jgi:hypothetical protein
MIRVSLATSTAILLLSVDYLERANMPWTIPCGIESKYTWSVEKPNPATIKLLNYCWFQRVIFALDRLAGSNRSDSSIRNVVCQLEKEEHPDLIIGQCLFDLLPPHVVIDRSCLVNFDAFERAHPFVLRKELGSGRAVWKTEP